VIGALARLLDAQGAWPPFPGWLRDSRGEGVHTVKKLFLLALAAVGAFAVWRKVQADRAELDLWTEATTGDD